MRETLASGRDTLVRRLAAPADGAAEPVAPAGSPRSLPVRAIAVQAFGLWLGTRMALIVFTYFAVPFSAQHSNGKLNPTAFPPHILLMHWWRWDAQWYAGLATRGYNDLLASGFFPLYPLLVHIVSVVVGPQYVIGVAMVVSNLATLAVFIGLGLLAANEYGPATATYVIRALAAFPLAFFLAAGYSDSTFIALAVFTLLFARRGFWYWAALCAFLATLTRLFGLVLILPMLWEYGRHHRTARWRDLLHPRHAVTFLAIAGAVPLALVSWATYLWVRFGDALAYLHVQRQAWGHYAVPPWQWLHLVGATIQSTPAWSYPRARVFVDLAPVVAVILLTFLFFRRWPLSLGLYMLGTVLILLVNAIPLDWNPFNGEGRYVLMCLPVFLLLGRWMEERPWLEMLLVGGGFMLQGIFLSFFLRGGWLV